MTTFDDAFEELMKYEQIYDGQITNDPDDPGKKTKYGISQANNPGIDIEQYTREQAKKYYLTQWWEKYKYHLIHYPQIAIKLFVIAVNIGPIFAARILQQALCDYGQTVQVDGVIGKETLIALNICNPKSLLDRYRVLVSQYYLRKSNQNDKYLKGWIKRALA